MSSEYMHVYKMSIEIPSVGRLLVSGGLTPSTTPSVLLADPKRRRTLQKIQPLLTRFISHPLLHQPHPRGSMPLRNLQREHQPKLPLRVHLTEHLERNMVTKIEVQAVEDDYDF